MKHILEKQSEKDSVPLVVIFDFGLVVGMDSSAAHSVVKLKRVLHKIFKVEVVIFVTGSGDGFPCEYALSQELTGLPSGSNNTAIDWSEMSEQSKERTFKRSRSISVAPDSKSMQARYVLPASAANRVYESLDAALMFAEDVLIARVDPKLVVRQDKASVLSSSLVSIAEERRVAEEQLLNLCPNSTAKEGTQFEEPSCDGPTVSCPCPMCICHCPCPYLDSQISFVSDSLDLVLYLSTDFARDLCESRIQS